MASLFRLTPFWDNEYKSLNYKHEEFNDFASVNRWLVQGYTGQFTGDMCDMRQPQPSWNRGFIDFFADQGWKDIGTSYYRMTTGTVLPVHQDLYVRYVKLFNLQGKEQDIRRAIVFLEDWQSGHYFELDGKPLLEWQAGNVIQWEYDAPHMAANFGLLPRYTLQITGHI